MAEQRITPEAARRVAAMFGLPDGSSIVSAEFETDGSDNGTVVRAQIERSIDVATLNASLRGLDDA